MPIDPFVLSNTVPIGADNHDSIKEYFYLQRSSKIFLNGVNFSPICRVGNNGICSDCVFRNNKAFAGGSIIWLGNDGLVNNTEFINSSATRVGGAIYEVGDNLSFNITCLNVSAGWLEHNAFYDSQAFVNIFYSEILCNIFGSQMDFTRCLFDTLFYGGIQNFNGTICYAQIMGTDFTITFAKDIKTILTTKFLGNIIEISINVITLTQTFYFENVIDNNDSDYYHIAVIYSRI